MNDDPFSGTVCDFAYDSTLWRSLALCDDAAARDVVSRLCARDVALRAAALAGAGAHKGDSIVLQLESVAITYVSREMHPLFERPRREMITPRWDPQLSTERS